MARTTLRNSSNRAIVVIGVMLSLYLGVLIGFGYIGQHRLRHALLAQEQLGIEKQAAAVAYFVEHEQAAISQLAAASPVRAFFTRRAASADTVLRLLVRTIDYSHLRNRPVLRRISLIDGTGQVLLEADNRGRGASGAANPRQPGEPGRIRVDQSGDRMLLTLTAPVLDRGTEVGHVLADIAPGDILQPLLRENAADAMGGRFALVGPADQVVIASDPQRWPDWLAQARREGRDVLQAPAGESGLRILALTDPAFDRRLITSPWFLAAVALFSVPLLGGMAYLLRLNNHNLVLRTRYQATTQRRRMLRKQNARLQREIDKRLESEERLAHQANYDQLTGLPNRNLAMDRLAQAIKWARREGGSVLVLFLDLDRFKQVNDSLGHAAGDELLREAAQRLRNSVRDSDTVSRLGGDEFLVICPDAPQEVDWEHCAQQMQKTLSAPFYIGDHEFFVGASIGVAAFPDGGEEPNRLLKNADIAMYAAKDRGRNGYCYYDPSMDAIALEGMRLENNLRHALQRDEFELLYQPIVDLSSGRTVAAEALLRWTSGELGEVSPDKFIPIAEETGIIHDIGEWVLNQACHMVSQVQPDPGFRIAINLSSKQFSRPGRLLNCVLHALRRSGLMPNQLELEITETILIDDRPEIADLIGQLDRIGVRLTIDDFGTGYSALNYLQRFPFDVLKIDRAFTQQIPGSDANASLIRAIIAMAHALGLEVVAEGIENRQQAGFLLIQHCELGQGFFYSQPMTPEQLRAHLRSEQAISA